MSDDKRISDLQRREAGHQRDLSSLMNQRPELRGVHPPADLVYDSIRWSA